MSDDEFLQALLANPGDDSLRLVYADWLEEQAAPEGLERATILRLDVRLRSEPRHYRKTKEQLRWFRRQHPRTTLWFEGCFGEDIEEMLFALTALGLLEPYPLAAFLGRVIRETLLPEGRRLSDFFTESVLDAALGYTQRFVLREFATGRAWLEAWYFEVEDFFDLPPAGTERLAVEAIRCAVKLSWGWWRTSAAETATAVESLAAEAALIAGRIADAAAERHAARRLHCRLLRECVNLPVTESH